MNELFPSELRNWLQIQGWTVTKYIQLKGGFAASIFQFEVDTPERKHLQLIYKRFSTDRAQELSLYPSILTNLDMYAPKLYGLIQHDNKQGIVIEDTGLSLKSLLPTQPLEGKYSIIKDAIHRLAELHIANEQHAQTWFHEGKLHTYSVESAQNWGVEAVLACNWLFEKGTSSIQKSDLNEIEYMSNRFYSQIQNWISGRMTLSHGDPHLENITYKDEQFRFIDWEYVCFTVPQRDLSIFLQDVLDEDLYNYAYHSYNDSLRKRGWYVDEPAFARTFQACLFDNTLMMLGWEIHKARTGYLTIDELERILQVKLRWLRRSFQYVTETGI